MLFHASQIVSVLILLHTSVSLAMWNRLARQDSWENKYVDTNEYGVGIQQISCGSMTYSPSYINTVMLRGMGALWNMENMENVEELNQNLYVALYRPRSTEAMPSRGTFYKSLLNPLREPNQPPDFVVFSFREARFVKVVTQAPDGQAEDCIPVSMEQSPERSPSRWQSPERSTSRWESPEQSPPRWESPDRSSSRW